MRIDVDFNERDRQGHVVARVPAELATGLAIGQHVALYDPPEKLWADAVVARVSTETHIAAFEVDWHSFVDAEVFDISSSDSMWSISLPRAAGVRVQGVGSVGSCTGSWIYHTQRMPWAIVVAGYELKADAATGTANVLRRR